MARVYIHNPSLIATVSIDDLGEVVGINSVLDVARVGVAVEYSVDIITHLNAGTLRWLRTSLPVDGFYDPVNYGGDLSFVFRNAFRGNVFYNELANTLGGNLLAWKTTGEFNVLNTTIVATSVLTTSSSLNDLTDVVLTTPVAGQFLRFDGVNWIDANVTTGDITGFDEAAQDAVGAALLDTATVDLVYNDGANTISANVLADTHVQRVEVVKNSGAVVGTRKQLNFIEGSNVTLTIVDDVGNNQVDITVAATDTGEANTASNVNVGGVGVFKQKTGVNLEFRGINAASSKITTVLDAGNNEIDIDIGTLALDHLSDVVVPTPVNGELLQFNGTNWVNVAAAQSHPVAATVYFFDDHLIADTTTANSTIQHGHAINWETFLLGTGAQASPTTLGINSTDRCIGVLQIETGTTATGRCAITLGDDQILFGFAEFATEWRVAVTTLSSATQEYDVYVGFTDNNTAAGEPVDGVYFKYDRNTSVNWIITTASNSVRTNTTTSVAVTATTPFQKLRVVVNNTGTSAQFFINGVSVGTHATNIPTAAGRQTCIGAKIEKTVGTTNRQFNMDYVTLEYTFTTSR